jgi:hypothetical protein
MRQLIESLSESLKDAAQKLRGSILSPQQSVAQGRSAIDTMLQAAFAGQLPDQDALSAALGAVTGDSTANYATALDFARAQAVQAGKLDTLRAVIERQGTTSNPEVQLARAQLESLADQRKAIQDAAEAQIESINDAAQDQIDALSDLLDNAKKQLDAANGINTSVLSVRDALRAFNNSISDLKRVDDPKTNLYTSRAGATFDQSTELWRAKGVGLDQPGYTSAQVFDAAKALAAQAGGGEAGNRAVYDAAKSLGISLSDLERIAGAPTGTFEKWARANGLPVFAQGVNYLPQDTLAMVHKGERIIPAADNRELMRRLNGNNVIDIAPLLQEIAALRAEVRAGQGAIASNTRQTKDLLDSTINGGNTIRTEVIAA